MGNVYADIELINAEDIGLAHRRIIGEEEIRRITVNALVDSGSYMLAINENIQEILQLPVVETRNAVLANGQRISCNVVSPLEIRFQNRRSVCSAMVLPDDNEPLLGVIPMEDMDVIIHPLRNELLVNPESPDFATMKMK